MKAVLRHNTVLEHPPESDVGTVKTSKLDLEWTGAREAARAVRRLRLKAGCRRGRPNTGQQERGLRNAEESSL